MTNQEKFEKGFHYLYSDDADEIETISGLIKVGKSKGVEISMTEARIIWKAHSESKAAGWLCFNLKDAENLINRIIERGEEIANEK